MSQIPPKPQILNTNLSKSLFIKGLQCEKLLWLSKYKKELLTPADEATKAVFERGNLVGEVACGLFGDGKKIEFEKGNSIQRIDQTKAWIDEGEKSIYEATFEFDGLLVMVDILHISDDGFEIYEVKSSTSLKEVYIQDVAVQYYVLKSLGYNISKTSVILLDKEYVRGDKLEIDKLFKIVDRCERGC